MFAEIFFVVVAIAGGIAGTITDIKNRWVPDYVNFSMLALGLGGHLILSILQWSVWPIVASLAGAGVFYGISVALFYTGQWGGGDAKMLIGFGALLPIYPIVLLKWFNPSLAPWPFLFTLWMNILIFGAVLGLLASVGLAIKHWKKFVPEVRKVLKKFRIGVYCLMLALIFPVAVVFLAQRFAMFVFIFWALAVIFFYIFVLAKAVENACMFSFIKPSKLVEGDWVTEEIKINGRFIYKPKKIGVEKLDILKLVELERKNKLNKVRVKSGFPLVPAFLIGLIVSLIFGDLLFSFMFWVV